MTPPSGTEELSPPRSDVLVKLRERGLEHSERGLEHSENEAGVVEPLAVERPRLVLVARKERS